MNPPQVYMVYIPHPEPSSILPPHTIPLGYPSALAPSIQYRALNHFPPRFFLATLKYVIQNCEL